MKARNLEETSTKGYNSSLQFCQFELLGPMSAESHGAGQIPWLKSRRLTQTPGLNPAGGLLDTLAWIQGVNSNHLGNTSDVKHMVRTFYLPFRTHSLIKARIK